MPPAYKRVPAVDKCFSILDLFAKTDKPMGISEISKMLAFNKSTVFNMVYTLIDLKILEAQGNSKFGFGPGFYMLGNLAGRRSELIRVIHPYLEKINLKTKLSSFLGIRSGLQSVLIDKVDSALGLKISSEIGLQMPVLAGAGIKAMLSLLTETRVSALIADTRLKKYTPHSIIDKQAYIQEVNRVRGEGIAFDREEYIEGLVAVAAPIQTVGSNIQAAIWAVGLKLQASPEVMPDLNHFLKSVAEQINQRLQQKVLA